MSTTQTPQEKFDDFIKENKIEYKFDFIPLSFSRNAKDVTAKNWDKSSTTTLFREKNLTLNWKISLKGNKHVFSEDFSKGIGHLDYAWLNMHPPIKSMMDAEKANKFLYDAVENGKAYDVDTIEKFNHNFLKKSKEFPNPTIFEALSSLVLDVSAKDHLTYESWASEFGYDNDSRKGEKIYNKCRETAANLIHVLGGEKNFDKLREIIWELDNEPYVSNSSKNKP